MSHVNFQLSTSMRFALYAPQAKGKNKCLSMKYSGKVRKSRGEAPRRATRRGVAASVASERRRRSIYSPADVHDWVPFDGKDLQSLPDRSLVFSSYGAYSDNAVLVCIKPFACLKI